MPGTELASRVADNAPAMLVYLDAELRVRFANRQCYELLGHAPRQVLGRLLEELVDPRTLKYALAHLADLERGNPAPRDYVLLDKDGAPRFLQVHAVADRDPSGRSVGYFTCSTDNSAARERQAMLRDAERRLALALETTRAGLWDWDLANGDVHYSAEFAALLGYEDGRVPAGFSFFPSLHPEDCEATVEAVTDAIEAGGTLDREFRMRCADGGYRWLRGSGRAVRDPRTSAVQRFTGTVRDIAPRREAQAQLTEARELAHATVEGCLEIAEELGERRRLDRVRHQLMAAANHEVRTPLASILAALELLRDRACPAGGQPAEAFLELALQNAERLARVVEEWLDMERVDLGFTRLQCAPVDLAALFASLAGEHAAAAEARGVQLDSGGAAPVWVNADACRLRHALKHLMLSAIERAPRGGTVRCQVGLREDRATLLIEDEGREALSGNDLGIGVARAVIERIGGTLCVANRSTVGVAFHVELATLQRH